MRNTKENVVWVRKAFSFISSIGNLAERMGDPGWGGGVLIFPLPVFFCLPLFIEKYCAASKKFPKWDMKTVLSLRDFIFMRVDCQICLVNSQSNHDQLCPVESPGSIIWMELSICRVLLFRFYFHVSLSSANEGFQNTRNPERMMPTGIDHRRH